MLTSSFFFVLFCVCGVVFATRDATTRRYVLASFRDRVLHPEETLGRSLIEVCGQFHVGTATVKRWQRLERSFTTNVSLLQSGDTLITPPFQEFCCDDFSIFAFLRYELFCG